MTAGITGFEPEYVVGLDAVRTTHGARLVTLPGRRLTRIAVVRFAENGRWYADCPVVLDFDGLRVEVCHNQFDLVSIGWNTIDTSVPIAGWEWFEFTPEWSGEDEKLGAFVGRALTEVALLEWRPPGRDLAAGTVAVEFVFDQDRFRISNGLDENHVDVGPAHPHFQRHPLEP